MNEPENILAIVLVVILSLLYVIGICSFLYKRRANISTDYQEHLGLRNPNNSNDVLSHPPKTLPFKAADKSSINSIPPRDDKPSPNNANSSNIAIEIPKTDRSDLNLLSRRDKFPNIFVIIFYRPTSG